MWLDSKGGFFPPFFEVIKTSQIKSDRIYALLPKKPGFLPNLRAATGIFVKNPVSGSYA
jgi:hypothetical protein